MTHLGILGAGQLGAYLCRAARPLNIETTVFAERANETAVPLADHVIYGDIEINDALKQFISQCDVVTFEKEDISVEALNYLAEAVQAGKLTVAPNVNTLLLLQNKAKQKTWLVEKGFPTAPFIIPANTQSFSDIQKHVGLPFVLKTQRGGYDGLGVKVVRTEADAKPFAEVPTIAEVFIEHKRELAVLVARNVKGESVVYPTMEMFFNEKGNVLRHILSPANISAELSEAATKLAIDLIDGLEGVGVFAVELFLQDGELLVNEISPRVHNAGHLTIEAQPTSQFEQHVRATCALPFGPVSPTDAGAMINLLYEDNLETAWRKGSDFHSPAQDTFEHWYNKDAARPLRKMGHITATGESADAALATAERHLQRITT